MLWLDLPSLCLGNKIFLCVAINTLTIKKFSLQDTADKTAVNLISLLTKS